MEALMQTTFKKKVRPPEIREVLAEERLVDLDTFATVNSKYPACIVATYQLFRDIYVKQELDSIDIIDGDRWGRMEYFIEATVKATGKKRLLIPFFLDAEIDLPWLSKVAGQYESTGGELFLCIHTSETIIYELVTTALP